MTPGSPGFRHEWLKQVAMRPGMLQAKHVAVALWSYSDERGFSFPNIDQIAQRAGYKSDSRVSQHIKSLVDAGFVRIGKQPVANGRFSNNYQLVLPTAVGSNSPTSKSISGLEGPEILKKGTREIAPTEVGAQRNSGELSPLAGGNGHDRSNDFVINGVDTRPPPSWVRGLA